jgi:glycosyltransferase involved in cell wall biosynthesis
LTSALRETTRRNGLKVLLLAKYARLHPSTRVRFHTYLPHLARLGIEVTVAPLLPESYTVDLFGGRRANMPAVGLAYLRRAITQLRARQYDVVWLEGELWPRSPSWGEAILDAVRCPVVVDYDDAIFHRYDLSQNPVVRGMMRHKIDSVMRHATSVVVANQYVRERAVAAGASVIHVVPSVVDLDRYGPPSEADGIPATIGWIGSPISAGYLESIAPVLGRVRQATGAPIRIVGAGRRLEYELDAEYRDWSEQTEVAEIGRFAVGIMPLVDGPIARGKSGYKLIQYMACCVPAVASAVGENTTIIQHGVDGLLANSDDQWFAALLELVSTRDLRERLGAAGRAKVELHYSVQATSPRMASILTEAAG